MASEGVTVGEVIVIALATTVAVQVAGEFTRPRGARMFNRGKNKESALLFDPASVPSATPATPPAK